MRLLKSEQIKKEGQNDMKKLWDYCKEKRMTKENTIRVFLIINIMMWCVIGVIAWGVISLAALKSVAWLLTIVGYLGFFPGFVGGMLYVMNRKWEDFSPLAGK